MIGQTISHYKITSKLGEGGMGEVYRAEDTTLKREVAIKVLPERFTQDDERLARFQREAQLLASLNHPNIAAIYGLEKADGVRFLVLELVEGETLAERLSKGPLPVEEALEVCRQIAEGLETAHESGVIHRDLKPANVNITPEGKVKVLDFGLAKAIEGESPAADLTHSPTRTDQMTNVGMIMGTAGYMSPEQARGQAVDKRTDIWAFGCVLFELLSGRAVHSGSTVSDILARVLERDPDWGSLPRETPDRIRQLLSRCLEKESRRRLRDIGEAVVALEDQLQGRSTETLAPTPKEHTGITPLLAAAGAVLMTLAVVWLASPWLWQRTVEGPLRKLELAVPDLSGQVDPVQISPDGQKILYGGSGRLWIRDLSQLNPREVPQSSDSHFPCWSPDSGSVAFVRDDKLWRVDLESGDHYALAPRPVDLGGGGGSVWLADGRILLVGGENSGAVEIPERGGNPQTLIELIFTRPVSCQTTEEFFCPSISRTIRDRLRSLTARLENGCFNFPMNNWPPQSTPPQDIFSMNAPGDERRQASGPFPFRFLHWRSPASHSWLFLSKPHRASLTTELSFLPGSRKDRNWFG